jgi:tetratricopeptide (TPR) repeat protein
LRADIREHLMAAITHKGVKAAAAPVNAGSDPKPVILSRPLAGSRSVVSQTLRMMIILFLMLLVLGGLAAGGWWLATHRPLPIGDPGPGVPTVTPTPTPARLTDSQDRLLNEARRHAERGDHAAATKSVEAFFALNPPDRENYAQDAADWYYELAKKRYDDRDYATAIQGVKRAIELEGASGEYHYLLGLIHFRRGRVGVGASKNEDLQAARLALEKTLELEPQHLRALDALAKTLIAQNERMAGIQTYYKIIELSPDSIEANQARRDLEDMGARLPN